MRFSTTVTSARASIAARGRFAVALSGGATPRALYARLAREHAAGRARGAMKKLSSWCEPLSLPPEPAAARSIPVSQVARHLETLDGPPIRSAWIERGNPATQNPASHRLRGALARLDLVVVVDQFMTPTAGLAHFVLPAKTLFEEEDLVTAYWHPYLQWRAKVLPPPGEVRPETEIWRAMCARAGFDTRWFPDEREDVAVVRLRDARFVSRGGLERGADGNGEAREDARVYEDVLGEKDFRMEQAMAGRI